MNLRKLIFDIASC